MDCPDDGRALAADATGAEVCPQCGGALFAPADLEALGAGASASALLAPETRLSSGAFARTRACPACATPMAPLRMGKLEAWVERCPSCERLWFDKQDRKSLALVRGQAARAQAVQEMPREERAELAQGLAASVGRGAPRLSGVHAALAAIGFPVVSRAEGTRTPWATWALAALLVGVHLIFGAEGGPASWGYLSSEPDATSAFTASLVHFGWLHLVGNVFFLLAFGDGVEQKLPRPVLVGAFFALGAASIVAEGWTASEPTLVAGASGAVAVLVGACVVLQPRATVFTGMGGLVFPLPMIAYGIFELLYQGAMALIGVPGVAWIAHLSGLAMGVALGLGARALARTPA